MKLVQLLCSSQSVVQSVANLTFESCSQSVIKTVQAGVKHLTVLGLTTGRPELDSSGRLINCPVFRQITQAAVGAFNQLVQLFSLKFKELFGLIGQLQELFP